MIFCELYLQGYIRYIITGTYLVKFLFSFGDKFAILFWDSANIFLDYNSNFRNIFKFNYNSIIFLNFFL